MCSVPLKHTACLPSLSCPLITPKWKTKSNILIYIHDLNIIIYHLVIDWFKSHIRIPQISSVVLWFGRRPCWFLQQPGQSLSHVIKNTGWWLTYPSEKWWTSSVGMMKFPTEWKNKFMFQTTNQINEITSKTLDFMHIFWMAMNQASIEAQKKVTWYNLLRRQYVFQSSWHRRFLVGGFS